VTGHEAGRGGIESGIKRIVVDLTAVLPGGGNGGAKIMTLELVRRLQTMAPDCDFILLTADSSHDELAHLDAANTRRLLTRVTSKQERGAKTSASDAASLLPAGVRGWIAAAYLEVAARMRRTGQEVDALKADLLFRPFTAPYYAASTPTVAVLYDLQHKSYPQNFRIEERLHWDRVLRDAARLADEYVCISGFVRESVLKHALLDPERVHTIHIQLPNRLPEAAPQALAETLGALSLEAGRYLLYPANFWPHKNHEALLAAFHRLRGRDPSFRTKLVCSGAPSERSRRLAGDAARMGLGESTIFPGYLPEPQLAALLQGCAALVYPSLYEGFGMPVLEAMAAGKPVLCSSVTSLPEIAGDAALYFDPARPEEIADAIHRLLGDPALAAELAKKGLARARSFGDSSRMASQYWAVFERAARGRARQP
jgi:glycosyltransferase involved in cell wall biosynthesis